jgi:3-isopropylmalate dehydrogenase
MANPLATLLSVAMMLRYGLGMHEEADRLENAVDAALAKGLRTPDLGSGESTREVGTVEMTDAVLQSL